MRPRTEYFDYLADESVDERDKKPEPVFPYAFAPIPTPTPNPAETR